MLYATNPAWEAVAAPAIAETRAWIAGRRFPEDRPLIDVAQAVPGYPPPKALTEHLARLVLQAPLVRRDRLAAERLQAFL